MENAYYLKIIKTKKNIFLTLINLNDNYMVCSQSLGNKKIKNKQWRFTLCFNKFYKKIRSFSIKMLFIKHQSYDISFFNFLYKKLKLKAIPTINISINTNTSFNGCRKPRLPRKKYLIKTFSKIKWHK